MPVIKTLQNGAWRPVSSVTDLPVATLITNGLMSALDKVKLDKTEVRDLLWTNPNPSSNFGAQTITLDLTDYDYIEILSKAITSSTGCQHFVFDTISDGGLLLQMPPDAISTTNFRRRAVTSTNSGVTFSDGYFLTNTNSSSCIPVKIYGIKVG